MKQRIITVAKRFNVIDQYHLNLDNLTDEINGKGWTIKQIVSTSFEHQTSCLPNVGSPVRYPVLAVTLLIEHP